MMILDSPLNKAGKGKAVYIHTAKNVLIQVRPRRSSSSNSRALIATAAVSAVTVPAVVVTAEHSQQLQLQHKCHWQPQ